ncbi:MAG: hypothetical protein JWP97_4438 [Labilithrix sp.]|nr:hypothetical protein [Labilithrix sp.]
MRLSSNMALNLFEAAEANGVSRERLTARLGYDAAALVDPAIGIEWDELVAVLAELDAVLGHDAERLRQVGRAMATIPSYSFLQRLARSVISLRTLYEAGERWLAPANVPHLVIHALFPAEDVMHFRCTVPEPHAPSAPYLHIFEGLLCEIPRLLGLGPATLAQSRVTPRELEAVFLLPRSHPLGGRLRRTVSSIWNRREVIDLLEDQRQELASGLLAVQQQTKEIQNIFRRLPDFVVIHRDGVILWTNHAMASGLGYDDDDALVGKPLLDIMAAESRPLTERRMRGHEDHLSPDLTELKVLRADGSVLTVEVAPTQVVSFNGQNARLVVARDITDRTRMQQQLLTADRMASIGMLAAGVAHEVNNPLAYVLNNIEMVIRDLTPLGERTERSREALAVALQGVDHIRVIVRDLLSLSRVDEVGAGSVDPRGIVESTLLLATQKIAERAELETFYAEVPLVRGTQARIGQVLLNLLANALEAMPLATRDTNRLRVSVYRSSSGGAVIEIADNGVGIRPEHAPRIFDPFFTTKALGAGTGLGLSISQSLVAEVGGSLSFESMPGTGSCFRVTLVADDSEPPPALVSRGSSPR